MKSGQAQLGNRGAARIRFPSLGRRRLCPAVFTGFRTPLVPPHEKHPTRPSPLSFVSVAGWCAYLVAAWDKLADSLLRNSSALPLVTRHSSITPHRTRQCSPAFFLKPSSLSLSAGSSLPDTSCQVPQYVLQMLEYPLQILNYPFEILNYPLQILNYPLQSSAKRYPESPPLMRPAHQRNCLSHSHRINCISVKGFQRFRHCLCCLLPSPAASDAFRNKPGLRGDLAPPKSPVVSRSSEEIQLGGRWEGLELLPFGALASHLPHVALGRQL